MFLSDPNNHTVSVRVGNGENIKIFDVFKEFLTYYSPYFRTAIENSKSPMFIPGPFSFDKTTPDVFGIFVWWLYTQDLQDKATGKNPSSSLVAKLWIMGDLISAPKLQNAAIGLLHEKPCLLFKDFGSIYDKTLPDSPLRKVHIFCLQILV